MLSDGREVLSAREGIETASLLQWDGDGLLVVWRTQRPVGEQTISFLYHLTDGGRRLGATEQVRGTDHDQNNVWVFERETPQNLRPSSADDADDEKQPFYSSSSVQS